MSSVCGSSEQLSRKCHICDDHLAGLSDGLIQNSGCLESLSSGVGHSECFRKAGDSGRILAVTRCRTERCAKKFLELSHGEICYFRIQCHHSGKPGSRTLRHKCPMYACLINLIRTYRLTGGVRAFQGAGLSRLSSCVCAYVITTLDICLLWAKAHLVFVFIKQVGLNDVVLREPSADFEVRHEYTEGAEIREDCEPVTVCRF